MNRICENSIADVRFNLNWNSDAASHTEVYHAKGLNLWRDWLSEAITQELKGLCPGERIDLKLDARELIPPLSQSDHFRIKNAQFDRRPLENQPPRIGRFYPKGVLKDIPGVFSQNVEPFRCGAIQNGHIEVDFNHPLAGKELSVSAAVKAVKAKQSERGGTSNDWMGLLTTGPGMQVRWRSTPTDFFSDDPYMRDDESRDDQFYAQPRLVHHLDDAAREMIRKVHAGLLKDGDHVLDLMSSWVTHLRENFKPGNLVGLGMNAEELEKNPRLDEHTVHDINAAPELPFPNERFDAVLCTASVEYLTQPLEAFKETARVLRPGGRFIITFSNRWFPPKAIRIWKQLHEYERMGLVLEYFLRSEGFTDLETFSIRGLPRPVTDKYFPQQLYSDPVFAVWGRKQ